MFHVERHPVEKAPPQLRAARNKVVDLRVDYLKRQRVGQRRRPAAAIPVDANLQPFPAVTNADSPRPGLAIGRSEQHELRFPVPDQAGRRRAAEGLSAPKIRQRLQEACLPGGVWSKYQVELRAEFQFRFFDAAEVVDPEKPDHAPVPTASSA